MTLSSSERRHGQDRPDFRRFDRYRASRSAQRLAQILGCMVAANRAQPVAWLARDMGASLQNIQHIMNELEKDGLVRFQLNPHHKRAHLAELTELGRQTYAATMALQVPWVDRLAVGLRVEDVTTTRQVILAMIGKRVLCHLKTGSF